MINHSITSFFSLLMCFLVQYCRNICSKLPRGILSMICVIFVGALSTYARPFVIYMRSWSQIMRIIKSIEVSPFDRAGSLIFARIPGSNRREDPAPGGISRLQPLKFAAIRRSSRLRTPPKLDNTKDAITSLRYKRTFFTSRDSTDGTSG